MRRDLYGGGNPSWHPHPRPVRTSPEGRGVWEKRINLIKSRAVVWFFFYSYAAIPNLIFVLSIFCFVILFQNIIAAFNRRANMKVDEAKIAFLKAVCRWPTFGCAFFEVKVGCAVVLLSVICLDCLHGLLIALTHLLVLLHAESKHINDGEEQQQGRW